MQFYLNTKEAQLLRQQQTELFLFVPSAVAAPTVTRSVFTKTICKFNYLRGNQQMKELFQHSWKIAVLITIVSTLAMGIGAITFMGDAPTEQKTTIEITPKGFKVENQIKKGQAE